VQLLEAISDFPVGKAMIVPRKCCLGDDVHPELPLIGAVGVRSNGFCSTRVALVVVAVVLGDFWGLWIRDLLDESGADARRLVEVFATLGTAVTGDLDFSIWLRSVAPFRVVSGFSTGRATVSTWLFVVLVPIGRGRLILVRLVLARWCMWSLVPPELRSETFVFLAELFILFAELFVVLSELFVFLSPLLEFLFKISKMCEDLFFGRL
jgi:hypothetical protein